MLNINDYYEKEEEAKYTKWVRGAIVTTVLEHQRMYEQYKECAEDEGLEALTMEEWLRISVLVSELGDITNSVYAVERHINSWPPPTRQDTCKYKRSKFRIGSLLGGLFGVKAPDIGLTP